MSNSSVDFETRIMPIFNIASDFEPNGFTNEIAHYKIPEHQRFFTWKSSQEHELIDTLIKGFPVPSIIAHEHYDPVREKVCYNIEDGQQRLTSLWRFINGKFSYEDKYYPCQIVEEKKLPLLSHEQLRKLETYQIPITVFKGKLDIDTKAEIFHRLNNGKKLCDSDKYWSMKNTSIVSYVCDILKSESAKTIGKFNFTSKTHSGLTDGVGLVMGLSEGNDKITTSYEKLYPSLNNQPNREKVENGLTFISNIYNNIKQSGLILNDSQRRSLGKILGILVMEYNSIIDEDDCSSKTKFWTDFLKIVARNDNNFWNQVVTKGGRGANIKGTILKERVLNIRHFMNLSEDERKTMCDVLGIEYVTD
jgi:hypothetical protein